MPVPKRKQPSPLEQVRQRQVADRAARARAAQPPRDPTGEHHDALCELAKRSGRDVVELLDLWDERAAVRTWEGEQDQLAAEREAVSDVREIVEVQPWLVAP